MDGEDGVYPSSEDTFLLMDALKQDEKLLQEAAGPASLCLEVGYASKLLRLQQKERCGSGEVTGMLSSILSNNICYSTDVNYHAAYKTQTFLGKQNIRNVELVIADMFAAFRPRVCFDVIVFNPPYVPTDSEELTRAVLTHDIAASWAGGVNGREVIDRFLKSVIPFLAKESLLYLVLLDANNPSEFTDYASSLGLSVTIVMTRKAGIETLSILRIQKDSQFRTLGC